MCTQVESEMLEPILVGDNDAYKRKIARRDAQGGAEGAHLRSTARDSSAGWLPKLTVWRLWGAYLDIVCCGIVASDERTLWGRGDGVYGPTFERRCVCLDVCVRFGGALVRAGRATRLWVQTRRGGAPKHGTVRYGNPHS